MKLAILSRAPRAYSTVRFREAAEQRGVNLGLELDVLRAGHLLDLLGDHELLLVLELDSGGHGGNLMGKGWDRDRQVIVRGWDAICAFYPKSCEKGKNF